MGGGEPEYRPRAQVSSAKVVPVEVVDAAVRARQILDKAQLSIAEQKAEFERWIEHERAALLRELRAEVELSLASKFVELAAKRQRALEQSRDDIVQLAQLVAERVLRDHLTSNPEQFLSFAEKCIAEARGSSRLTVHAHPEDVAQLQSQLENLREHSLIELRVEPDAEMLRGDLRLESDVGTLDARLGTQLSHLAETIRESLRV